ncbi:MAG TPA: hypothetical protein VLB44_18210 [Kofleriaceae bacterium]|nr:hypothetical protein [Kofleriaceae bacterium]
MRTLLVLFALVLASRTAHAQMPDFQGGAQLHYELEGLHAVDHPEAMTYPEARDFVIATARLHGFIGGKHLGFHMGLDLGAGGTIRDGGFAYDVSLFPFGVAFRFFETSFLTLGAGIGAAGATGTLDDAVTFPLEARLEIGRGIRLLGRARATFVDAARMREGGAAFADELEGMLGLRFGTGYDEYGFPTGNGYFVGATFKEQLGTRFLGLMIGYSIDMGTRRKPRTYSDDRGCPDCE